MNIVAPEVAAARLRDGDPSGGPDVRIEVATDIDAPPATVWAVLEPVESHVEWMADAERITFRTEQHRGVGTEFECLTRVGPLVDHRRDDRHRVGARSRDGHRAPRRRGRTRPIHAQPARRATAPGSGGRRSCTSPRGWVARSARSRRSRSSPGSGRATCVGSRARVEARLTPRDDAGRDHRPRKVAFPGPCSRKLCTPVVASSVVNTSTKSSASRSRPSASDPSRPPSIARLA